MASKRWARAAFTLWAYCRSALRHHDREAAPRRQLDHARDFGHLFGRDLRETRVVSPATALDLVLKAAGA